MIQQGKYTSTQQPGITALAKRVQTDGQFKNPWWAKQHRWFCPGNRARSLNTAEQAQGKSHQVGDGYGNWYCTAPESKRNCLPKGTGARYSSKWMSKNIIHMQNPTDLPQQMQGFNSTVINLTLSYISRCFCASGDKSCVTLYQGLRTEQHRGSFCQMESSGQLAQMSAAPNLNRRDLLSVPQTTPHLHNKVRVLQGKKMPEDYSFIQYYFFHEEATTYLPGKISFMIISFEPVPHPNLHLVYYRLKNISKSKCN